MVDLPRLSGLDHESDLGSFLLVDKMVVDSSAGDESGKRKPGRSGGSVGEDDDPEREEGKERSARAFDASSGSN